MASESSEALCGSDDERLDPALADELTSRGLDAAKVSQFIGLLQQRSVTTRGALRLFAKEVDAVVFMMFDMETKLEELKARGFLAALRVRHSRPEPPPCIRPSHMGFPCPLRESCSHIATNVSGLRCHWKAKHERRHGPLQAQALRRESKSAPDAEP